MVNFISVKSLPLNKQEIKKSPYYITMLITSITIVTIGALALYAIFNNPSNVDCLKNTGITLSTTLMVVGGISLSACLVFCCHREKTYFSPVAQEHTSESVYTKPLTEIVLSIDDLEQEAVLLDSPETVLKHDPAFSAFSKTSR